MALGKSSKLHREWVPSTWAFLASGPKLLEGGLCSVLLILDTFLFALPSCSLLLHFSLMGALSFSSKSTVRPYLTSSTGSVTLSETT